LFPILVFIYPLCDFDPPSFAVLVAGLIKLFPVGWIGIKSIETSPVEL
jgi:hypothetical protein